MTPTTTFFAYNFGVNIFRFLMYIFNIEYVTKVKINKKDWESEGIREVAFAYTKVIRNWMFSRAAIQFWAIFLEDSTMKNYLCLIFFCLDVHILFKGLIANEYLNDNHNRVMNHKNPVNISPFWYYYLH